MRLFAIGMNNTLHFQNNKNNPTWIADSIGKRSVCVFVCDQLMWKMPTNIGFYGLSLPFVEQ